MALLDVNVLIVLLDAGHVHHGVASKWLSGEIDLGFMADHPNGCVRTMSQPAYPEELLVGQVVVRLKEATLDASHEFWPADLNLLDGHVIH